MVREEAWKQFQASFLLRILFVHLFEQVWTREMALFTLPPEICT
jgi:hypothetical protein